MKSREEEEQEEEEIEEAVGEVGGGIAGGRGAGGGHRGGPLSALSEAEEEEQQEKLLINLRLMSFVSPDGRKAEFDCVDREASLLAVGGAAGEINTLTSILIRGGTFIGPYSYAPH